LIRQNLPAFALVLGLGLLEARSGLTLRADLQRWRDASEVYPVHPGVTLRALTGFDIFGHQQLALPGKSRHFAVFVLHAKEFDGDMAFWSGIAASVAARPGIALVGVCDSEVCADAVRRRAAPAPFLILDDLGWAAIQYIRSADQEGDALLVNPKSAVEEIIPWKANLPAASVENAILRAQ